MCCLVPLAADRVPARVEALWVATKSNNSLQSGSIRGRGNEAAAP